MIKNNHNCWQNIIDAVCFVHTKQRLKNMLWMKKLSMQTKNTPNKFSDLPWKIPSDNAGTDP